VEHKFISISFAFGAIVILFLSLFNPLKAYGQYYSQGGDDKEISIDKKVRSIGDTQYFDNIEASRKTFFEKDVVEFQIKVENIGNETLSNIKVRDTLPKYLSLIFYPGTFNEEKNSVEWFIDKLDPGQDKTYLVRAKIDNSTKLMYLTKQTNKGETCVYKLCDTDYSSYFIGKTTVPAAGAPDIVVKTILVALTATSGFYFRKLARGY
jgi:uncharacterized repeat protein (TIGR01451 family)